VNDMPGVATEQCGSRKSNPQPVDCKSSALTTTLPSHTCICYDCVQVARIQQQVLDALRQESQSNPAVQEAVKRLNSQLFDISAVSCYVALTLRLAAEYDCESLAVNSIQLLCGYLDRYQQNQNLSILG